MLPAAGISHRRRVSKPASKSGVLYNQTDAMEVTHSPTVRLLYDLGRVFNFKEH